MPVPVRPARLVLFAAGLSACSHAHPAASPVDETALQIVVDAEPYVRLGELTAGSVPLASVYNLTQAARGSQAASILAQRVSHEVLHDGLRAGARAGLPGLQAAPGAAVQVALERWGVTTALPSDPGSLQVTVQARLLGGGAAAIYTRPITCSLGLHTLATPSSAQRSRHADQVLEAVPNSILAEAARTLAADCGVRALRELAAT